MVTAVEDDFRERFALLCRLNRLRNADVARTIGKDQTSTSLWLKADGAPRDRAAAVRVLFGGMSLAELYSLDLDELRAEVEAQESSDASAGHVDQEAS